MISLDLTDALFGIHDLASQSVGLVELDEVFELFKVVGELHLGGLYVHYLQVDAGLAVTTAR